MKISNLNVLNRIMDIKIYVTSMMMQIEYIECLFLRKYFDLNL